MYSKYMYYGILAVLSNRLGPNDAMKLTRYTDYAMRVLLYLGTRPEKICSIAEIARTYGVSQNHLMKVVNDLANAGYVASLRGRSGGLRLGRPADEIDIGEVVRHTEEGFDLVDCATCFIAPACGLNCALAEALAAFMAVLDGYTLADLIAKRDGIGRLFELREARDPSAGALRHVSVDL